MDLAIPMKPEWTREGWDRVLAIADRLRPAESTAALEALRDVFPPELVEALQREKHPLVARQLTYAGRLALLELGYAIVRVGLSENDLGRLRDPSEYEATAAELLAALLFVRTGARVERPEAVRGRKRCEYIVERSSGERLAIEAKLPNLSDGDLDTMRVETELLFTLMSRLSWLPARVPCVRATFHFAPTIARLGDRNRLFHEAFQAAVDDAVARIFTAADKGTLLGATDLGLIGTLEVREDLALEHGQFDAVSPAVSPAKVDGRLRRNLLNDAIQKFEAAELPGIIVLDIDRDALARNALGLLVRWAKRKESLVALLVIDRLVVGDPSRAYGSVDVVPGPRFAVGEDLLCEALEACEDGHLHYNPLSTLTAPCPMVGWLSPLPDPA